MLRVGKLTDYAMLVMSELAKEPNKVLSATSIAERLHLTASTVSKVLKILAENCLVQSVRGAEGGYHLAKEAQTITLAHIIDAMEGAIALTACTHQRLSCKLDTSCALKENWKQINHYIYTVLNRLTIQDMLNPLTLKGLLHDQ